jgi:RNA polymerase II subunit A C-terminal domain phosphatase SSU72
MHLRGNRLFVPLLVINLDVRDNATEAGVAAPQALALCQSIQKLGEGWEGGLEGVLNAFEQQHKRRPLYAVCYY